MSRFRILVLGLLTVSVLVLDAGAAQADNLPREHDSGFFLRLSAGGGGASTELESGGDRIELSGSGGDVNIAIGAIVTENLAIHGTLWGWLIQDPDVEFSGSVTGSGEADADIDMSAIGVGVTYYLMPANLYFSGSVGAATLTLDSGNLNIESDTGIAFDLTVGKEWWVGDKWGLGAALAFDYHSVPDGGDIDENWKGPSFAIRFTATYN